MHDCGHRLPPVGPTAGVGRGLRPAPPRRAGFTLLEILLTLALIALLAGALIGGSSALISERAPSAQDVFWSAVRTARKNALNSQRDVALRFDDKAKAFVLTFSDGPPREIPVPGAPADLAVDFLSAQRTGGLILLGGTVAETEPLPGGVTFYADGTCP